MSLTPEQYLALSTLPCKDIKSLRYVLYGEE